MGRICIKIEVSNTYILNNSLLLLSSPNTSLHREILCTEKRKNASNYRTFILDTKIHEKAFFVTSFNMSPYVHLIVDTFFEPNFSLQKLETLFLLLLLLPLE